MKITDAQLDALLKAEEYAALEYEGELAKKRAKNMDYYNTQPYGDEVDGQSQAVTSDVSDVIEWMLPSLMRTFTQGKLIGKFESFREQDDQEADEKEHLANHVFMHENNGTLILHNMFKDALLQYTGVVKVSWDESKEVRTTKYEGLSELELQRLQATPGVEVKEVVYSEQDGIRVYDAEEVVITNQGRVRYDNIPPEEFLICKSARDFNKPKFIGHRSPKTRSDLLEMGFDKVTVNTLPADDAYEGSEQKAARYHDYADYESNNPANHSPNDIIYLGEYYYEVDIDGDGITEYWKVFYAGNQVLEKEQVEDHPFAVAVPIPIPHRAIGTCPAEQVADIQFRKSVLVRQMLDNVYQTNYPRTLHSNKVDLDDLLTPRPGGTVEIDTDGPDVAGHVQPLVIPNMIDGVMKAIEYTDMEREIRTGITRYSQGLDAEALNKTATGFKGIMDASQQRLDLIARMFSEAVKRIFALTVDVISKNQDEPKQIKVLGKAIEIDPRRWGSNISCRVDVGIGAGDRQEKLLNLNNVLQIQERYLTAGLPLADPVGIYNTLEKLVDETGLKDAAQFFNNPEIPEKLKDAQLFILDRQNQMLKQQIQQNPLAEAELIKAQAKMAEVQGKESNSMRQFVMEMAQKDEHFRQDLAKDLTELELKYGRDVPGSNV